MLLEIFCRVSCFWCYFNVHPLVLRSELQHCIHSLSFNRGEGESHMDFKAMIICLALHLLLFMFELLVCINLGLGGKHYPWRLTFMPLYVLSLLSIIACIWGFRHDRSFEVGALFANPAFSVSYFL